MISTIILYEIMAKYFGFFPKLLEYTIYFDKFESKKWKKFEYLAVF